MPIKTRPLRARPLTRGEILRGAGFLFLVLLMTVLAIYLNIWLLEQEESHPEKEEDVPAVSSGKSCVDRIPDWTAGARGCRTMALR